LEDEGDESEESIELREGSRMEDRTGLREGSGSGEEERIGLIGGVEK